MFQQYLPNAIVALFILTVASTSSDLLARAYESPTDGALHSGTVPATAEQRAVALVAQLSLAEKASLMAQTMAPVSRLGVGPYQLWNEALHGVNSDLNTTQFPQVIGLAASFDDELVNRVAMAISSEVRAVHAIKKTHGDTVTQGSGLNIWAPNLNIFRDPRWGRGQETFGEDPFLTSRMGVAYVRGIQGPDPLHPEVIASPKHFAVHSGPELTRHEDNVEVSPRDLEDTYLPAFRAAVMEGKAGSIMCAYNAVNGQPACANDLLLKQRLRRDWGFGGFVVSDCDAIYDISDHHQYTVDGPHAVAVAVKAGVDNECAVKNVMGDPQVHQRYVAAVERGLLSESDLDRALIRVFTARYRLGAMDPASTKGQDEMASLDGDAHRTLAREAAGKSMVLLKNEGVLPLANKAMRIAVVGPLADSERVLYASYATGKTGGGLVTVVDGLRNAFPNARIDYVPGAPIPGDLAVVPTSALLSQDGRPGLTARYYDMKSAPTFGNRDASVPELINELAQAQFEDMPALTKLEPHIDTRSWPTRSFLQQRKIVWTGYLQPPASGTYVLGIKGGIGGELSLDGKKLVSLTSGYLGNEGSARVELEKGRRYPVALTSREFGGAVDFHFMWRQVSTSPIEDAVAAASRSDVVIAVVGLTSDLEGEESQIAIPGFESGDRTSLDLPEDQQELLKAVEITGKPLVMVTMSGSALNLSWAEQSADAIVQAWYPGEEGGNAVADVLSGKINPAGRLPVTFYRDVSQLPPFRDYSMASRTYRYFTGTPVYPFGYGLSYTSFRYGEVEVAPIAGSILNGVRVRTELTNTGKRDGDEVAQLYLTFPESPGVPKVALRGFRRVHLAAGEHKVVEFKLKPRDMSSVSMQGEHRILAGRYWVSIGGGQPDEVSPDSAAQLIIKESYHLAH